MNLQPLSAKANNLRLQQSYFGHPSTAATGRILMGNGKARSLEHRFILQLTPTEKALRLECFFFTAVVRLEVVEVLRVHLDLPCHREDGEVPDQE